MAKGAGKPLMHPSDDWVQWVRAPFFFVPEMATSPEAWLKGITELVSKTSKQAGAIAVEQREDYVAAFVVDGVELQLDASQGEFRLWLAGDLERQFFGPCIFGPPPAFFDDVPSEPVPAEDSAAWTALYELAQALSPLLSGAFEHAVRSRRARVFARARDPLAPFTPIDPDQLRCFERAQEQRSHDDDGNPQEVDMVGPDGAALYSVYVAPEERRITSKPSTKGAETRAVRFLTAELRACLHAKPTKDEMRKKLRADGIIIGDRAFDRAWKSALAQSGRQGLASGGRPPKTTAPINHRTN
jgi:hypothetical protein